MESDWDFGGKLTCVYPTHIFLHACARRIYGTQVYDECASKADIRLRTFASVRIYFHTQKEKPHAMTYAANEELLQTMKECNRLLDMVSKGLGEYLESKRLVFPRFFFLSDDELLEILSEARNPLRVQPHVKKCFENINTLTFGNDPKPNTISAMNSAEGEKVTFNTNVYSDVAVEEWLLQVEQVMGSSLRELALAAFAQYVEVDYTQWVLQWPAQIVIAGGGTYFTANVEHALQTNSLAEYHEAQKHALNALSTLMISGDLSRIHRALLSALITLEVHARDVVARMVKERVAAASDFEWMSQLRYYWIPDTKALKVRAMNAEFDYMFEYLGNTGRLVITPLTDRCYLTLTNALRLRFGGAPAGPAGTGKTETCKDLAKAMAILCIVYNCSDQLDFMAMGKFFKGISTSGSWITFDEFNRIDIEVLSVVAQQITTIQKAQQQNVERFLFEGNEIALKPTCAVFITMNPGYAGRTELPDNLKALFRPVAMMVPDYGLIAEISLLSFGFRNARDLANKMVTTLKLCSEQLSHQYHYDYGMRAVKAIINAAANLKRDHKTMPEDTITLRSIRDVNLPKFLDQDLVLFRGIISDLFPFTENTAVDYGKLQEQLRLTCKEDEFNLQDVKGFVAKCLQLYETTVVRHGLMIVGPTAAGKTCCYKVLARTLTTLVGEPSPSGAPFQATDTFVVNPKSITMGQLYGEYDAMTHEWTDGIFSTLVRLGTVADDNKRRWYVFDGPVDAVWIENMNSVLDDNKKLCLSSGEIMKITDNQILIFEVDDLSQASPATVSRCGMVYMEPSVLGLDPMFYCWLRKFTYHPPAVATPKPAVGVKVPGAKLDTSSPAGGRTSGRTGGATSARAALAYPKEKHYLTEQVETMENIWLRVISPAITYVRYNVTEIVPSVSGNLVASWLKLLDCCIDQFKEQLNGQSESIKEGGLSQNMKNRLVQCWCLFALIWSVGATCDIAGRKKFSAWLYELLKSPAVAPLFDVPMPYGDTTRLCYDYVPSMFQYEQFFTMIATANSQNPARLEWLPWMDAAQAYVVPDNISFVAITVPTVDTVRSEFVLDLLLRHQDKILCVGNTGTGKTLTVAQKLSSKMPEMYVTDTIAFSARSNVNQIQVR